jgi:hypothetical protein
MASTNWPEVGRRADTMNAHAASLKVDIARLHDRIEVADQVPAKVFQEFSLSVDALLDKVLARPVMSNPQGRIARQQNSTQTILKQTSVLQTPPVANRGLTPPPQLTGTSSFAPTEPLLQRSAPQSSTKITLPMSPSARELILNFRTLQVPR